MSEPVLPGIGTITRPEGTAERIGALDVLRGLAILGTFATNVWLFAYPGGPVGFILEGVAAGGVVETATHLVLRTRAGALQRGLAAVGRTALSCYVLQNLVASVLCYGWGLGLAARFAGPERYGWTRCGSGSADSAPGWRSCGCAGSSAGRWSWCCTG